MNRINSSPPKFSNLSILSLSDVSFGLYQKHIVPFVKLTFSNKYAKISIGR